MATLLVPSEFFHLIQQPQSFRAVAFDSVWMRPKKLKHRVRDLGHRFFHTPHHHPLRHVDPGAGDIGPLVNIDNLIDRSAMDPHP
jgi:hypothetical protein